MQNDQTNQRFTRTGGGEKNETHKMTMTSVASADQKQQANKQSSLFMSNQMKSHSQIQNMLNKNILKPNAGVSSYDENVKILKTTRKSVFD